MLTCPTQAIEFSNDFEQSVFRREVLLKQLNYLPEKIKPTPAPAAKPTAPAAAKPASAAVKPAEKEDATKPAAESKPAAPQPESENNENK